MKKYIDISLPLNSELPIWPGSPKFNIKQSLSIKNGDTVNDSCISMNVHTATHVDAPSHCIDDSNSVETMPFSKLIGPAYVAKIKGVSTISSEILTNSNIPENAVRLLLLTDNSDLYQINKAGFNENYVAISHDAAEWMVERNMKLIGIDYLSIQKYRDTPETHRILLSNKIVILEGLNLKNADEGWYELVCLPLRLEGIEASPARAILIDNINT